MKLKFLTLSVILMGLTLSSCGGNTASGDDESKDSKEEVKRTPTKQEMIDLNNDLVAKQNKLFDDYDQFFVIVETGKVDAIERQLNDWQQDTENVLKDIKAMDDFEETAEFKQSLIDIAEFQKEFVNNEAAEITDFFKNINDLSDEEYELELERLKNAINKFEEDFLVYNDVFISSQKKFASKHEITLTND